jgi:hypothetical protein
MPLTLPRKLCSIVGERNGVLCNYAIAGESTRINADIPSDISEMTNRLLLRGCAQISFAHYPSSSVGAPPAPRVRSERDGVATSPASCSTYVAAFPPPGAGELVPARLPLRVEPVRDVHGPGVWDDLELQPRADGAPDAPGIGDPAPQAAAFHGVRSVSAAQVAGGRPGQALYAKDLRRKKK